MYKYITYLSEVIYLLHACLLLHQPLPETQIPNHLDTEVKMHLARQNTLHNDFE